MRWGVSVSRIFRRKRFIFFQSLLNQLNKPISILDVGGTQEFWETADFINLDGVTVTLLNLTQESVSLLNFFSLAGDGLDMPQFADKEFDIVFSNSVIEHVGGYEDMQRMANEVRRVGKRYFVQTPNKYFPIEPHFFFPLFQFLPIKTRAWLLTHYNIGPHYRRTNNYEKAKQWIEGIRLIGRQDLIQLFPEAVIYEERFCGMVKSFTAYYGF